MRNDKEGGGMVRKNKRGEETCYLKTFKVTAEHVSIGKWCNQKASRHKVLEGFTPGLGVVKRVSLRRIHYLIRTPTCEFMLQ